MTEHFVPPHPPRRPGPVPVWRGFTGAGAGPPFGMRSRVSTVIFLPFTFSTVPSSAVHSSTAPDGVLPIRNHAERTTVPMRKL